MEKLKELAALVECSIYLGYNHHKDYYESVQQHWFDPNGSRLYPDVVGDLDDQADVWSIQVYPRTPISFYRGISNDLDALIDWAIEACKTY